MKTTLIVCLLLFPLMLQAACEVPGKVISITDGDTFKILDAAKQQHRIRILGIDAPEKGQPYSKAAKKHLSQLIAKKTVCLEPSETDKYQRTISKVILNDVDIGLALINSGYAWHYKKYMSNQPEADQALYAAGELQAKLSVIGLWSEPNPVPPWDWRTGKRKVQPQPIAPTNQQDNGFTCGTKRFCKQMQSCEEACFYLNQCGLGRLDRDKDSIPCESFCGGC